MAKSFKLVFILIILLIIVINALQITWLFNSIQITKEQYRQTLNKSLSVANGKYSDIKTDAYIKISGKLPPVFIIGAIDETKPGGVNISPLGSAVTFAPTTGSLIIDTLESYYAKAFWTDIADNNTFDLYLFDSLFRMELIKNGIKPDFKLDTSHIAGNLTGTINQMTLQKYKEYPIQTWGITIGTFGRLVIWASFKPNPEYILRKLLGILLINALILVAGNGCLLYILKTLQKQKQATEVRNDFISNMTHELKTPVSVIATALDSLLEHKGIDNKNTTLSFLSISREQTRNLSDLIDKILTTSITDDTLQLNKEPTNIVELIENLLLKYEVPRKKAVSFGFHKSFNKCIVPIDRLHLTNVVNNLVENAIKYSNDSVHIEITIIVQKNKVTVQVKDNGIGIEKRYHENIFDKFFRVPTGNLYNSQGTGLGLNYCKTIIEKHDGKIEVSSTPGKGSVFSFELPKPNRNEYYPDH